MIEKLEKRQVPLPDNPMVVKWEGMDNESLFNKINELVDAVNGILAAQEQYTTIYKENIVPMLMPENATNSKMENVAENFTTGGRIRIDGLGDPFAENVAENGKCAKNAQDPYAEQRNYDVYVKNRHLIGKLCKFKCGQGCYYGILTNIKRKPHEIPFESNGRAFRTCEPVKPTDSIIYKGNDNEK